MPPPERTVRQRIIELLIGTRLSSYQLAQMVGIAERLIEGHLPHVVKTLARDRTQRFVLEPAACSDCGFVSHMPERGDHSPPVWNRAGQKMIRPSGQTRVK